MDTSLLTLSHSSTSESKFAKLSRLFTVIQQALDAEDNPMFMMMRAILAKGIQPFADCEFVLEGKEVVLSIFSACFKRCALLWKELFKECQLRECSQRLLLKLDYCQQLTIKLFKKASLDLKLLMASSNSRATAFMLDFCVAMLQGVSPRNKVLLNDSDYKYEGVVIRNGGLFTCPQSPSDHNTICVCATKILQQLSADHNYFELEIVNCGLGSAISIGVAGLEYPLDKHAGWHENGIGYHSDDGRLFNENSVGQLFGPTSTSGDRLGCGIDFGKEDTSKSINVFFTKNGQRVGNFVKFKILESGLYPFVGMDHQGDQFRYLGLWQYLPQGQLPAIASQIATTMAEFLQQFQWYLPIDVTPIVPEYYQGLIERISVTAQPNKVQSMSINCRVP